MGLLHPKRSPRRASSSQTPIPPEGPRRLDPRHPRQPRRSWRVQRCLSTGRPWTRPALGPADVIIPSHPKLEGIRSLLDIELLLARVSKPARYTGGELHSVRKDWSTTPGRIALVYPDVYEVGMSNLGLQLLYGIVNHQPDLLAERAYAPWVDMEKLMRDRAIPLFSLESRRPLSDFDLIGISLSVELDYTNVLNILNLSGVPILTAERGQEHPIILAGGSGTYNPEPLADFFDVMVVGDGEEVLPEVMRLYASMKPSGRPDDRAPRREFLRAAAALEGVYVPSLYQPQDGGPPRPIDGSAPATIQARRVSTIGGSPRKPIVPFVEPVHDRAMVEVQRGCTRGCRFCQAGIIYRPVREQDPEIVLETAEEILANTGHDEVSLVSLSTSDYSGISVVLEKMAAQYPQRRVKVSLPSLRVDSFSVELAHSLKGAYGGGLTFAPEAGTQRLRDVINKGVTQQDIEDAAAAAFSFGWQAVKLYFMIGLPTETAEDIDGIAKLAYRVRDIGREKVGNRTRVKASVGAFIPKPNAPFQWSGQESYGRIKEKMARLQKQIKGPGLSLGWHDAETSIVEAALARGDRRTGAVILRAWQMGCKFDAWSEHFSFGRWAEAFSAEGMEIHAVAERSISTDEPLPWDHISPGVKKAFLVEEYERGLRGELSPDCRTEKCLACGVRQAVSWLLAWTYPTDPADRSNHRLTHSNGARQCNDCASHSPAVAGRSTCPTWRCSRAGNGSFAAWGGRSPTVRASTPIHGCSSQLPSPWGLPRNGISWRSISRPPWTCRRVGSRSPVTCRRG